MNQLAFEPSFHPGSGAAFSRGPAYYYQQGGPGGGGSDQAFAYPGQQHGLYHHDGVNQTAPVAGRSAITSYPQQYNQNIQPPVRVSASAPQQPVRASPQQSFSPSNAARQSPAQSSFRTTPPSHNITPMAALNTPNTSTPIAQSQPQPQPTSTPQTPSTPTTSTTSPLETQRISHILTLNTLLLTHLTTLQTSGSGGALNPAAQAQLKASGRDDKLASEEYIQCMRRVQANLGYLGSKAQASQAEGKGTASLPGPAIVTAPSGGGEELRRGYERLRELFPGWEGVERRISGAQPGQGSPRVGGPGGAAGSNGVTSNAQP